MDYFFLTLIPISLVLPHLCIATFIFVINRNLSSNKVFISSFCILIFLVFATAIFPSLHSGDTMSGSNIYGEWLKFLFFGKGDKIKELADRGIEIPHYFFYLDKLISVLFSAWFTSKIYVLFKWIGQKFKTELPEQI